MIITKKYLLLLPLLYAQSVYAECEQAQHSYEQALASKQSKNMPQALVYIEQSIRDCPFFLNYYEQGRILASLGRIDPALESFQSARNHSTPNSMGDAKVLAWIAAMYLQKESLQQASMFIEQAYDIKQNQSPKWIIGLRKKIDLANAQHITTAREIQQVIGSSRANFGVAPRIQFNSITFQFNSTEFTPEGEKQVRELGKVLGNGGQQALIIGHTDSKGDASYNMDLSERRADAVKAALVKDSPGLRNALKTQGKGETELRYLGDDETDHQLNRRVEMQLL